MNLLINIPKEKYSQIPNELINDMSLSSGAFRLIAHLFTKPPHWNVYNKEICTSLNITEKTLTKYWKELEKSGWLEREKKLNDKGQFTGGNIYRIGNYSRSVKSSESVKSYDYNKDYNLNNKTIVISKKTTNNKTSFPKDDLELKEYAILKAVENEIKCPLQTYEAFKDHHIANGSKFKNWQSAFKTWIRNFFKFKTSNEYEIVKTIFSKGNAVTGTYNFQEEHFNDSNTGTCYILPKEDFLKAALDGRITLARL